MPIAWGGLGGGFLVNVRILSTFVLILLTPFILTGSEIPWNPAVRCAEGTCYLSQKDYDALQAWIVRSVSGYQTFTEAIEQRDAAIQQLQIEIIRLGGKCSERRGI